MNKNITNQPILIRKVGFKMKKIIILLSIISIVFIMTNKESEYVIIPKDSIRFRIIPNSNTVNDLYMKELVKEEITSVINEIETSKNITETREKIMRTNHQKTSRVIMMSLAILIELLLQLLVGNIDHYSVG